MKELRGRTAVVTGGASGIGKALAKAFLAEGMNVVVADVEEGALESAVADLGASGGNVSGHRTDVSDAESVQELAEAVFSQHGACHVLCNNAGVGVGNSKVWETTVNDWRWVHGVNVMGVVHGILSFVPRMLESGEEGLILNTSSGDGGISPLADQSVYASSKAAISILTECLAAQLAAHEDGRVRAAVFYPSGGLLDTGLWTTARNRPAELARERPYAPGAEMTFDQFMRGAKKAGLDIPVQDLDELAAATVGGIKNGDFVIMLGREMVELQLVDRAKKIAAGECPISAEMFELPSADD
jgi:NAD(P)-dependent dehydrogenase (short-subunit alcohol dehydrogenase family)